MRSRWIVVVASLVGCGTKSEPKGEGGGGPGAVTTGSAAVGSADGTGSVGSSAAGSGSAVAGGAPMRFEFGLCADAKTSFISTEPAPPMQPLPGSGLTGTTTNGAMEGANGLRLGGDLGSGGGGQGAPLGGGPGGFATRNGIRAPNPVDRPGLAFGNPTVQGDLDSAIIRRYVRRTEPKLRECYTAALKAKPKLGGLVAADFMIDGGGVVIASTAEGVDPAVSSCIAGVIKAITFPKPKGSSVKVRYPFTFSSPPAADPHKIPPTTSYRPTPADPPAVTFDDPNAKPPVAGENPLRARESALATCFAGQKFGAVTVAMGYDASGNVTGVTVAGTVDAKTAACVSDAAKGAKQVAGIANETCGFAFGEAALDDWPTIAITDASIAWNGVQELAKVADIASAMQIKSVYDRVKAWDHETRDGTALVPVSGPIAIRVRPTTPMKLVNRVAYTIQATGTSFVFAVDDKLVGAKKLPRPPLPQLVGTGDRTPQLSVLATTKVTWVGVSTVNKFEQLADDAAVATALRAHKASPEFKDRTRIEIAVDDALAFERVTALIAIVEQAGFTDWQILPPPSLSADPRK